MIPVYIINLKHQPSRWNNTITECKKHGISNLSIHRIDGVYGKKLTPIEIQESTSWLCGKTCTTSSIGCAMSHIKAWKQFLASNHNMVLIFEDDVNIKDNFQCQLKKKMDSLPKDFDIFYIGCAIGCKKNSTSIEDIVTRTIHYKREYQEINEDIIVPENPLGLHAYILSKAGAKKLLDMIELNKISSHIDVQILNSSQELNVYASNPLLVYQNVDTSTSNNTMSYPVLINKHLHQYKNNHEIPRSYAMSVNIMELFNFPINGYAIALMIICLLYSILSEVHILFITLGFFVYNIFELKEYPSNLSIVLKMYLWILFWIFIGRKIKRFVS